MNFCGNLEFLEIAVFSFAKVTHAKGSIARVRGVIAVTKVVLGETITEKLAQTLVSEGILETKIGAVGTGDFGIGGGLVTGI